MICKLHTTTLYCIMIKNSGSTSQRTNKIGRFMALFAVSRQCFEDPLGKEGRQRYLLLRGR